jgi:hypothetical protein
MIKNKNAVNIFNDNQRIIMAFKQTRDPSKLSDSDYYDFVTELSRFLTDDILLDDISAELIAEQKSTAAAYCNIYESIELINRNRTAINTKLNKIIISIKDWLDHQQIILSALGIDNFVIKLGIDREIKSNFVEIKKYIAEVNDYYRTVKNNNYYSPLKTSCNKLSILVAEFEKVAAEINIDELEYKTKIHQINNSRKLHNTVERKIFGIYSLLHNNPRNNWWINSPWGKADEIQNTAPTNIKHDGKNLISWNPVKNAEYYEVFYSRTYKDSKWIKLYYGKEPFTTNPIEKQGIYLIHIRAYSNNIAGKFSEEFKIFKKIHEKLPAPVNPIFEFRKHARFSWFKVTFASGYRVQKSYDEINWRNVGDTTDTKMHIETGYGAIYFRVCALNDDVEGKWTEPIYFKTHIRNTNDLKYIYHNDPEKRRFVWTLPESDIKSIITDDEIFYLYYSGYDTEFKIDLKGKGSKKFRIMFRDADNYISSWSDPATIVNV